GSTSSGTKPSVSLSIDQDPARTQTPMADLPALRALRWSWSLSSTLNHIGLTSPSQEGHELFGGSAVAKVKARAEALDVGVTHVLVAGHALALGFLVFVEVDEARESAVLAHVDQ